MKVLAAPARRNHDRNPFNFLLSEALAAQGCEVVDVDDQGNWAGRCDVFHIHWPQHAVRGRKRRALRKSAELLALLAFQRLRGARIVWTVHNVRSHSGHNTGIERVLMWFVTRLVHGVIFLTPSSRAAACFEMSALAKKPFAIIPHGLYDDRSQKTREEARASLGLPADGAIVGFLGEIRPYKGLDSLLAAVAETPPAALMLFIAGAFPHAATPGEKEYIAEVRGTMADLRSKGHAIVVREERPSNLALVDAIRACDLIALPYRATWNSGLALLVLENGGRIFANDAPVFRELREELGPDFVHICEEGLTGDALLAATREAPPAAPDRIAAFSAARNWSKIGAATLAFYRRLGAKRQGRMIALERST